MCHARESDLLGDYWKGAQSLPLILTLISAFIVLPPSSRCQKLPQLPVVGYFELVYFASGLFISSRRSRINSWSIRQVHESIRALTSASF